MIDLPSNPRGGTHTQTCFVFPCVSVNDSTAVSGVQLLYRVCWRLPASFGGELPGECE